MAEVFTAPPYELLDFHALRLSSSEATRAPDEGAEEQVVSYKVSASRVAPPEGQPDRVILSAALSIEKRDGAFYRVRAGGMFSVFDLLIDDDEALRAFAGDVGGFMVFDYVQRQVRILAAIHEHRLSAWDMPDIEVDETVRDLRTVKGGPAFA